MGLDSIGTSTNDQQSIVNVSGWRNLHFTFTAGSVLFYSGWDCVVRWWDYWGLALNQLYPETHSGREKKANGKCAEGIKNHGIPQLKLIVFLSPAAAAVLIKSRREALILKWDWHWALALIPRTTEKPTFPLQQKIKSNYQEIKKD